MNQENQIKTAETKDLFSFHKSNDIKIRFQKSVDLLCPQLQSLDISFCNLSKVPKIIFSVIHLTELNLSNNCLMNLPSNIGNLHNLLILNLSGNKLTSLPSSVKCIHNLSSLDISYNEFFMVPHVLYNCLGVLKILDLSFNKISNFDCAPKCINTLKFLKMSYNNLTGLPKWILYGSCELLELDVCGNCIFLNSQINDFCTARVFVSLHFLSIENCLLNFEKVQFLGLFKNLEVLYVGNKISKNLMKFQNCLGNLNMDALKNLKTLRCLHLQNVQISILPSDFNCMKNLETLDLSENLLSWLPESLCDLVSLKILNLMSNQLIFLPTDIGKLINLQELHLGNNNLYFLPEGIYNLNNLEYVDFYNNKLEDINFMIFKRKKLKGIDLELNFLLCNFCTLNNDFKLQYDRLKTSLRQHFGYVNRRCDAQLIKSSSDDGSEGLHNSSLSNCSETVNLSDSEDFVTTPQIHCQDDSEEEEDWENEIVSVKEDDVFNPNEVRFTSRKSVSFKEEWNSEFRNNYCPAYSHKRSFREIYAKNVFESRLENNAVDGQFDSD